MIVRTISFNWNFIPINNALFTVLLFTINQIITKSIDKLTLLVDGSEFEIPYCEFVQVENLP